jgi:hypothetical protein
VTGALERYVRHAERFGVGLVFDAAAGIVCHPGRYTVKCTCPYQRQSICTGRRTT